MAKKSQKISNAFHEVFHNVPKTVKATGKTGEAKRKMMVAVALSKARQAGAKIPKGGNTELEPYSMKAEMCADRVANLTVKSEFVGRKRKNQGKF